MLTNYFPFPESWKNRSYLNAAAGSPMITKAYDEAIKFYEEIAKNGDISWDDWMERLETTRALVSKFINTDKDNISFQLNTSGSMGLLAMMLESKYKKVLTMDQEFPSTTLPWLYRGYDVEFLANKDNVYDLGDIEQRLSKGDVDILVTSHIQYSTGFKQDLEELGKLCEEYGVLFIVNATQSAGQTVIDVERFRCDALMFDGYKWLCSGYGVCVLYLSKWLLSEFDPPTIGWLSVENEFEMINTNLRLKKDSRKFELGCPQLPCIFALYGALNFFLEKGTDTIERHNLGLRSYLESLLDDRGIEYIDLPEKNKSGIVVLKGFDKDTVHRLENNGVYVSYRKGLRISLHFYNDEQDIERLLKHL